MKKWAFSVLVILLLSGVWEISQIHHDNSTFLSKAKSQAVSKAKQKYQIKKVENVAYYHGTQAYQVVHASLENNNNVYIWVPEKKGEPMLKKKASAGLTKKEALKAFKQLDYSDVQIKDARLGMVDQNPVWEIIFVDQNKEYNYVYLNFVNGKEVEHILHL